MSDLFIQSLQITALGMGLVFSAIIVLWLMMVLLTTFSREKDVAPNSDPSAPALTPASSPARSLTGELPPSETMREGEDKAQAAAIAVAIALAEQEICAAHPLPEPPTAIVSAWQLGMRTRLLTQKGNVRRR